MRLTLSCELRQNVCGQRANEPITFTYYRKWRRGKERSQVIWSYSVKNFMEWFSKVTCNSFLLWLFTGRWDTFLYALACIHDLLIFTNVKLLGTSGKFYNGINLARKFCWLFGPFKYFFSESRHEVILELWYNQRMRTNHWGRQEGRLTEAT